MLCSKHLRIQAQHSTCSSTSSRPSRFVCSGCHLSLASCLPNSLLACTTVLRRQSRLACLFDDLLNTFAFSVAGPCITTPEDKQPVRGTLEGLDRAQTQAADLVTVQLQHGQAVTLKQNPTALKGSNVRVGACAWDGAYVLSAYLDAQPPGAFAGALPAALWKHALYWIGLALAC